MTNNIVKFPEQPRLILVCTECGCQSFYFFQDGAVECCNCEMPHENGAQFVSYVSHLPSDPSKTDHNSVRVRNFGVKSFALASVYKAIAEWFKNDNLICLIAYNKDGEGKQWFDEPMLENLDSLEKFIQFMKKKDA